VNACNEYRKALQDRFDCGEDLTGFTSAHAAKCPDCQAYRADLLALANELASLEAVPAPEDLPRRIVAHVRANGVDYNMRLRDYAAVAAVATVFSVAAGWYMPYSFDSATIWMQTAAWWSNAYDVMASGMSTAWIESARASLSDVRSSMPAMSPLVLWPALAVTCLSALAFNAFFAVRFRTAGD
jgi:hypothetical protein